MTVQTLKTDLYKSERILKVVVSEIRGNIVKKQGYAGIINTPYHSDAILANLERDIIYCTPRCYRLYPLPLEEIEKARRAMTDALFKINYELDYTNTLDMLFTDPFHGKPLELSSD